MSFENLIRDDLLDLSPYASARSEKLAGDVWLNANELPWDNTKTIGLENINRYPEQQPEQLISKLAGYNKINNSQILVTRGSDEGIDLLIRLFCNARVDSIAALDPTFGMYKVCAKIQGVQYIKLNLNKNNNYAINIDSIEGQLEGNTKIL
ncbi:MAG: histidinol-phosphate aminotransferase, partial [Francisellaceae bacterium]